MLDNVTIGQYSALAAVTDYNKVLFEAHSLDDGPRHYLVLTNDDEARSLAFDMAIVQSAAAFEP